MSPGPLLPAAANRQSQSISSTLDSAGASKANGSALKDRLETGWSVPRLTGLKLEFEGTSDNQGRVTVYSIEVLG